MRIRLDLAVLGQERTLKDAGRRNQHSRAVATSNPGPLQPATVGWIAMEWLWQLSGLHDDLRAEVQERDARHDKSGFYSKPDFAIELQSSVLHKFGHFPTGDDAQAEDTAGTAVEKVAVLRLQSIRLSDPPNPNVGVQ